MNSVFACGFECGLGNIHWALGSGCTITTSSPLSGVRSLSQVATNPTFTTVAFGAGLLVWRFKIRFSALPTVDSDVLHNSNSRGVGFRASDSSLVAKNGANLGTTGVAITTGVTYSVDVRVNTTANPHLVDVQVDGVACSQLSSGIAANTGAQALRITLGTSAAALIDDVVLSTTTADYPIGPGYVNHFIPTADGTHNIAGTADFRRTLTGTDILNATTDAYLLVGDVPMESGASVDWINMLAPPNATDYVECIFGPASGISAPTTGPRAVEVVAAYHQSGTGAGNMEIRLNDNGTQDVLYTATGVAGVTSVAYARKHYAAAIAGGGAWVIGGGGNGDFTDLRVRFGSPAALDVNPDQYFDSILIEAEFAPVVATQSPTYLAVNQAVTRASVW